MAKSRHNRVQVNRDSEEVHVQRDRTIVLKPAESTQQVGPVVLTAAYERQKLRACVADVHRDMPAVLRNPPERNARRMAVRAPPKVDDEGNRQGELEQRSAEKPEEFTERREDQVTCLVNRQIDSVEDSPVLRPEKTWDSVQGERASQEEAHATLAVRCGSLLGHDVHLRKGRNSDALTPRASLRFGGSVYRARLSRFRIPVLYASAALAGVVSPIRLIAQARDSLASTGSIAGVVRDSSGAGVVGADLLFIGTVLHVTSDTAGRFRFTAVPIGAGALQVRRLGYRATSIPVNVDGGATTTLTITLALVPRELDPVLVEASRQPGVRYLQGFYERRSKGHGYFITRDQIATRQWSDMTDVLRSLVPAVRISSSRMARNAVRLRNSRCAPLVWLDGAPAMAGEFDLDVISPETVSGIEVYPGPATVPVEFRSTRGIEACGVIVVWSRVDAPEPRTRRKRNESKGDSTAVVRVYNAEEVDSAARVDSTGISQPFYPDSLYAFRVSGEVVAQFVVDTTGQVLLETFAAVSSTHPAFTESVRRSLAHSKFHPAMLKGRRVRQLMVLPYRFVMQGPG
jgi:hypothetical protein